MDCHRAFLSISTASVPSVASVASTTKVAGLLRGDLSRVLDLFQPSTSTSPYQRQVYRGLLAEVVSQVDAGVIEQGLVANYGTNFHQYAVRGTRLLVILARKTPVARFALSLRDELARHAIDLSTLASGSEAELFPELFDNPLLSEVQLAYLSQQLDNEYEVAVTRYIRLVVHAIPVTEISPECTLLEAEICWVDGQRYCYDLISLLERLAAGNEYNPHTGRPLPATTVSAIRLRYSTYMILLQRYLTLRVI